MFVNSLRLAALGLALVAATPALANSWLIVAIDDKGTIGIGKSPDAKIAKSLSLSYCGQPGCHVISRSKANCIAAAQSFENGYWIGIGTAGDKGAAIGYAVNFCARSATASTCKVAASACQ